MRRSHHTDGFTLIELSIVLVIIGLIVGGVLVGRDLIEAAKVRAQATQLDRYSAAMNTFQLKYNAVPGDMLPSDATNFGLPYQKTGGGTVPNGNGSIDCSDPGDNCGGAGLTGIDGWVDTEILNVFPQLSGAKLIDGTYCAYHMGTPCTNYFTPGYNYPAMKLNPSFGILIADYSNGGSWNPAAVKQGHWFFLGVSQVLNSNYGWLDWYMNQYAVTPAQSYALDSKIDDGLPNSGTVLAVRWAGGPQLDTNAAGGGLVPALASPPCIDTSSSPYKYNMSTSAAANNVSCLLAVRMQ